MNSSMFFASALSTKQDVEQALSSLVAQVRQQMKGRRIDALFLFLSPDFVRSSATISSRLRQALKPQLLLGCTGEAIIGRDDGQVILRVGRASVFSPAPLCNLSVVTYAHDGSPGSHAVAVSAKVGLFRIGAPVVTKREGMPDMREEITFDADKGRFI